MRNVYTVGGTVAPLEYSIGRWFHAFRNHPFEMSFVINGVMGPVTLCRYNTPIALDLDHSGNIESIDVTLQMDLAGNGVKEEIHEWFTPEEGILIDTSVGIVNGEVTGEHLFGDMGGKYLHGYEKLAVRDLDENGVVEGAELKGLAVWTDANSNGHLDDGELSHLADHGVLGLKTNHVDFVSSAVLKDGKDMVMEDLWFARR